MKTRTIGGVEYVECNHCGGSGVCQQAVLRKYQGPVGPFQPRKPDYYECQRCGRGLEGMGKWSGKEATKPYCTLCEGKGFYRP